jgi:hypothetical protein
MTIKSKIVKQVKYFCHPREHGYVIFDEEIAERRRKLQERREETERDPAYVKKANQYDKYLAK